MSESALFVTKRVPSVGNTTPYQRLQCLSNEYDLTVFTFNSIPPELAKSATIKRCPDSLIHKLLFPIWIAFYFIWSESEFKFVYSTFHKPALLAGIFLKALGLPFIADLYDDPTLGMQLKRRQMSHSEQSLSWKQWASYIYATAVIFIIRPGLKFADLCIFVPDIAEDYGIDPMSDSVLSITNGVDFDLIQQASPISNDTFTIVYVGHVQQERGAGQLLEAADILKQRGYEEINFNLIGPIGDGEEDLLRSYVEDQGLDEMVSFTGELPHNEALNHVGGSDVCVCILSTDIKNYRLAYPLKLFEYMALAKPIVATNLPGISTVIKHRENGLLVPPDSPSSIADQIQFLFKNPDSRAELASLAREDSFEYAWSDINKKVLHHIRAVV